MLKLIMISYEINWDSSLEVNERIRKWMKEKQSFMNYKKRKIRFTKITKLKDNMWHVSELLKEKQQQNF